MAVYKATYCFPFLNNANIRNTDIHIRDFLKCQVDTSNKNVTGYKIRILDSNNNQIFPIGDEYISPISELREYINTVPKYGLDWGDDTNTGLNGTCLEIPFFRNFACDLANKRSFNALYYNVSLSVDYLVPTWTNSSWNGIVCSEIAKIGATVLHFTAAEGWVIGTLTSNGELSNDGDALDFVFDQEEKMINVLRGDNRGCYKFNGVNENTYEKVSEDLEDGEKWYIWSETEFVNFNKIDNLCKWEITLYQGPGVIKSKSMTPIHAHGGSQEIPYIEYNYLSDKWYDVLLNQGTVLGSTNKRIQISKNIFAGKGEIPQATDNNPLVLQGTWVQLLRGSGDLEYRAIGNRAYVQTYDATYGHVYPKEGSFTEEQIYGSDKAVGADKVCFYKHSNLIENIEAGDIVDCATTGNLSNLYTPIEEIAFLLEVNDYELSELQLEGGYTIKLTEGMVAGYSPKAAEVGLWVNPNSRRYSLIEVISVTEEDMIISEKEGYNSTKQYWIKNGVYKDKVFLNGKISDSNDNWLPIIDGYQVKEGDRVLVKSQDDEKENGVYIVHKAPDLWKRSGSYNTWGSFIGKIIFVKNGAMNGGRNFESLAKAGGSLYLGNEGGGSSPLEFQKEKPIVIFEDGASEDTRTEAYIMKNSPRHTFVSPFSGLKPGQLIKFNNRLEGLESLLIQAVDTTTWKITHKSIEDLFSNGLSSFDGLKYNILSNFRSSDENVFYTDKIPYLIISRFVENAVNKNQNLSVGVIQHRYVVVQGEYVTDLESSWESYRWILKDTNGNVLQDTGYRYSGDMKTSFYGLTNGKEYIVQLIVEDSLGNILEEESRFKLDTTSDPANVPFSAEFDCSVHGVKLSWNSKTYIMPTNSNCFVYTDNDLVYDKGAASIKKQQRLEFNTARNIYASSSSKKPSKDDGAAYAVYEGSFSKTENMGLSYGYKFGNIDNQKSSTDNLTTDLNTYYLQTSVLLCDNYQGQILELKLGDKRIILSIPSDRSDDNWSKIKCTVKTDNDTVADGYLYYNGDEYDWLEGKGANYSDESYSLFDEDDQFSTETLYKQEKGMWYWPKYESSFMQYINSKTPLGNCCLQKTDYKDNVAGVHWVENRGTLAWNGADYNGLNYLANSTEYNVGNDIPSWPSESDEGSYAWIDGSDVTTLPASWNDIRSISGIYNTENKKDTIMCNCKVAPIVYQGLSTKKFTFIIRVNDIIDIGGGDQTLQKSSTKQNCLALVDYDEELLSIELFVENITGGSYYE